jgi:serine/threonine-protein kinase
MSQERWRQIQDIFDRAADLPADEQVNAVTEWGGGDPALVADVLMLLQADAKEHPLLDKGAEGVAASLFESGQLPALIERRIGPYRLLGELGEGGMGIVYLAERTDLGSLVAIKLLRDAWISSSRRDRFAAEQRMLAQLNHPGIARIYDSGSLDDGTPWFVMEYVAGMPVTEYCKIRETSIPDVLRLFRRICEAVAYAHRHAIIHRDLKPSNILVTSSGEVKLLDFGIAKQLALEPNGGRPTIAALSMMTPGYSAPEQWSGGAIGVSVDIYALGVLLYEILAGQLPFDTGKDMSASLSRRENEDPRPPSAVARANPSGIGSKLSRSEWADLDAICMQALRFRPEDRYRSVDAMAGDVDAFLDGRPLTARVGATGYRFAKFVRRNRVSLVTTAAVLLLAVASGIFFTVRLARARNTALAEAARSQRIKTFMLNLFGNKDTEGAPSADLKVLSLLDRGVKQADSLNADAETQGDLYEVLGSMYSRLDQYDKASELLNRALERTRATAGPESVKAAGLLVDIGMVKGDQDKLPEAQHFVEQASTIIDRAHLPASDPIAMSTRVAMGRIAIQSGAYAKAIELLTPVAEMKPPYTEQQSFAVRDALAALVSAELPSHQLDVAKATSLRALEMDRELLGESHLQTGVDTANLASIEATLGNYPEAEKLYRQGVGIVSAWMGPSTPDVATGMSFLAQVLSGENKNEEAEGILKQVLDIQLGVYGNKHNRVAFTRNALGDLELKRGDLPEAESEYRQAAEISRSLLGETNLYTALYDSNLANAYLRESKDELAEKRLREDVKVIAALPQGNNLIGVARGRWGRSLLHLHRYSEAEEQLVAASKALKAQARPSSNEVQNVCHDLAAVAAVTHRPGKVNVCS